MNLVPVEKIIAGVDIDPHGILKYVQFAPKPDGHDTETRQDNYAYWCGVFDRLPRPEIDGEAVEIRSLAAPRRPDGGE